MKNLDNNLLQAYYIAVMLGIDVELYEIDEKNNVLINKDMQEKAQENDLTYILDCIETSLENQFNNQEE